MEIMNYIMFGSIVLMLLCVLWALNKNEKSVNDILKKLREHDERYQKNVTEFKNWLSENTPYSFPDDEKESKEPTVN